MRREKIYEFPANKTAELRKALQLLDYAEDILIKVNLLNDKMRSDFDSLMGDIDSILEIMDSKLDG